MAKQKVQRLRAVENNMDEVGDSGFFEGVQRQFDVRLIVFDHQNVREFSIRRFSGHRPLGWGDVVAVGERRVAVETSRAFASLSLLFKVRFRAPRSMPTI